MKNLAIALYLIFNLFSSVGSSQEYDTDSIASIGWMVGKWNIEASENDSDDSAYKERGFLDCSWVLNGRVIRCDEYVTRTELKGRYADLSKTNSSIYYFTYNKTEAHYELTRIGVSGTRTVAYSKKDHSLNASWSFVHSTLGFKMFIDISLTMENENSMVRVENLKNSDETFTERYEAKMTRIE